MEVARRVVIPVSVFLVQHHLASAQFPVIVELPKDSVSLLGMSHRIVLEDDRQSLALLFVPGFVLPDDCSCTFGTVFSISALIPSIIFSMILEFYGFRRFLMGTYSIIHDLLYLAFFVTNVFP